MKFENIFTEYNDSLEKTVNLDPLGFNIIWTHFGQRIFNGKISSSTWDIRSFNINLFNHYVIKMLMKEGNQEIQGLFERNKKETIEKLILLLENMVIWSWYTNKDCWDKNNLLGTAKAISKWEDGVEINCDLTESIESLELLKGQKSVGVNGRYKGSFMSIGFFDSNYNDYFDDEKLFDKVDTLIQKNKRWKALYSQVIEFFKNSLVDDIPTLQYKEVFSHTDNLVDDNTKAFWMTHLGLDKGTEGTVANMVYAFSKTSITLKDTYLDICTERELEEIQTIITLEPKLSYLDALFNYLLFQEDVDISEIEEEVFFKILKDLTFKDELQYTKDAVKERLEQLDAIEDIGSLIDYHQKIMEDRGYSAWLRINDENKLKINIKSKDTKEDLEKKLEFSLDKIPWIHSYYMGSIKAIKKVLG